MDDTKIKKSQLENKISSIKQYKSDRIIDSINPITWNFVAKKIVSNKFDVLIFRYWHPFFIPCYNQICKKIKSLTDKIPKPMVDVNGKPFLFYLVEYLKKKCQNYRHKTIYIF